MNRRGFFAVLAGVAATAVLDPERLLWVPGKKLISIPRPRLTIAFEGFQKNTREEWAIGPDGRVLGYSFDYGDGVLRRIRDSYWIGKSPPFVPMPQPTPLHFFSRGQYTKFSTLPSAKPSPAVKQV
ncbi:MAG: hypothetical protein ABSD56_00025 [Bryobacteraceae bacterium]|jgi:hypothetical protein